MSITLYGKPYKPMLATKADLFALQYPIAVTPKIDGIRCFIINGKAYSRSLKPIRNKAIQAAVADLPCGLDGELIATSGSFQDSTSCVMSEESTIAWQFMIFDYLNPTFAEAAPYDQRMRQLQDLQAMGRLHEFCQLLLPTYAYDMQELLDICQEHLTAGYEGTMVRSPRGGYKFGRSTVRESLLLKIKEFADAEAVVTGYEELLHNGNEATINELGLTQRSGHKGNKTGSGMLGAIVVHLKDDPDVTFKIGTGFTHDQRTDLWQEREQLIGRLAKFKYFAQGIKSVPRFPVWLGWRDPDDL